uniref:RNA-dependent RNA polymerase n=1 Tax=Morus alba cryptic virus 2 TaxID=3077606 RepID=A0AA96HFI3_9VIRU|nr:putative RNA-dependent RNA polymerase [Morus alba cryptic virus 2]
MDHPWRGLRNGLIKLEETAPRRLREEEVILIDPFASDAISKLVPLQLQLELDGWARSFYTYRMHLEAVLAYDKPKLPQPGDVAWVRTRQFVEDQFRRMDKVRPISYTDMDHVKWVRASAAGYGYQGLKGDGENYLNARKTAFTIAERLNHDREYGREALTNSTPDLAFTRTQLCQIKVKRKVRNVWGEAFHYVLLEGLFADPLIQHFIKCDSFYFIGQDPLLAVPLLIEEMLATSDYIYMFDWSGFDSSVHEWEIRFAFQLLESLLIFPTAVELHVWRFLIELFIYRKISVPHGAIYLKTQGIPSGSCFTNIIGSITNYVRIQYMFYRLTTQFATVYTHGDDSLAGIPASQFIPMDNFGPICSELNWTINLQKSDVSSQAEGTTFLSRTVREQQHARDELVCLRMLKFPEYPVLDGAISTLRAFSISRDAGIESHYLYKIYKYLLVRYGKAESLPFNQRNWNPLEYESLRLPFIEYF